MPEENFWTLWCKERLTDADTLTIRLGATASGLTSAHLHHPPFLQAICPSCRPTNSIKALKATSAFRLGRRRCTVSKLYLTIQLVDTSLQLTRLVLVLQLEWFHVTTYCFTMLEVSENILGGFHMLPQTLVQLQELLTE